MDDTLTQNNADITKNVNKQNKLLSIFIINRILSLATYWIHLSITEGKMHLLKWLNKHFRIEMTDGRILIGVFLCTDRDANVILGSCSEYLKNGENENEEPRVLGLVMVPGRHIVSIQLDDTTPPTNYYIED